VDLEGNGTVGNARKVADRSEVGVGAEMVFCNDGPSHGCTPGAKCGCASGVYGVGKADRAEVVDRLEVGVDVDFVGLGM
jgi:hypothetical protein